MVSVVDLAEKRARKDAEGLCKAVARRFGQVADKDFIEGVAKILLEAEQQEHIIIVEQAEVTSEERRGIQRHVLAFRQE